MGELRVDQEQLTLQGLRHLKSLQPLLSRQHDNATGSDRAYDRSLFYDQLFGFPATARQSGHSELERVGGRHFGGLGFLVASFQGGRRWLGDTN